MKSIFDLLKMSNLLLLHYTTGWFREFEIKLKEEYNAHFRRQFNKVFVLRQSKRKCNLKCKLKFYYSLELRLLYGALEFGRTLVKVFFSNLSWNKMANNADDNVDLSEKSSDERRHKRKKFISLEINSCKKRRRITSPSSRDSSSSSSSSDEEQRRKKRKKKHGKENPRNIGELNLPI